jgi:hypothetical protein
MLSLTALSFSSRKSEAIGTQRFLLSLKLLIRLHYKFCASEIADAAKAGKFATCLNILRGNREKEIKAQCGESGTIRFNSPEFFFRTYSEKNLLSTPTRRAADAEPRAP